MGKITQATIYETVKKLNFLCATIAGLVLLFVTFSIFIDVFLRYFFNRPSIWITEVSSYLFLYIIFLGTAYALQQGLHIRVTFLLDRFNPRLMRIFDLITSLFAILFSLVLLWQTSVMTWTAFSEDWTSPTMLSAPYAYIYVVMVFGSLLLCLTFVLRTIGIFLETGAQTKK
ncbi:TRAP transporter small permease [Thermodesulfobacteriota bacterium]